MFRTKVEKCPAANTHLGKWGDQQQATQPHTGLLGPLPGSAPEPGAARSRLSILNLGWSKAHQAALSKQLKKILLKEKPHLSKSGYPDIELNGKVEVSPSTDSAVIDTQTVRCYHLAILFAKHKGKKHELLPALATRPGIRKKFDHTLSSLHEQFHNAIQQAPQACKHVVQSDDLGRYLTALAQALNDQPGSRNQPKQVNCLLLTDTHALALHLQRKCKEKVVYFAVKVYDPNDTACYKRVVRSTPQDLSNLTLDDLLVSPNLIEEYAGAPSTSLSMVAVSLDTTMQPLMDRAATLPCAENMSAALRAGACADVEAMLESWSSTHIELFDLLNAKSLASPVPGLHMALQDGYHETVEFLVKFILNSPVLSHAQKIELLAAKDEYDHPGLMLAMHQGQEKTVQAFSEAILSSETLSQEEKTSLLAARSVDGVTGLTVALHSNQSQTISTFAQTLLNTQRLDEASKTELLMGTDEDGRPGLEIALENGHTKTVELLTQTIRNSNLSPEAKAILLDHDGSEPEPGQEQLRSSPQR